VNQPWLSILIPTYNGESYLAVALESILIQNDLNIECIIVDDGSTDSTLSIISSYQDRLPIKIIQRERIGNWVTNTNHALSLASADYACFLHQDDLWRKDRLKIMKDIIDRHPEINLFLHASQFIDSQGRYLGLWQCPLPQYPSIIESNLMLEKLLIQNFIAIPAPIFKREIVVNLRGLDEKLWYTADWDFWLKIAASGKTIYYPKSLASFRVHVDSQTITRSEKIRDFSNQLEIVARRYFSIWEAPTKRKEKVWKIALFSINLNTALAAKLHGNKINLWKIFGSFFGLGFRGWYKYFRDSRIWERISARLKSRIRK
jgi:glycosyltransferase involved in cell wall biosynthesis